MTTGAFWNVSNPQKPWGLWDGDAKLYVPFDWFDWLAQEGATYVSHSIETGTVMDEVSSAHAAGVITAYIKVAVGQTAVIGTKYPIRCRIVASKSGNPMQDDRTVWLKIVER